MPVTVVWLLTIASAATAGTEPSPRSPRSETAGLALAAQGGRYAGGYGLDAIYYHPLPLRPLGAGPGPLTLWAHLGLGVSGELPRAPAAAASVGASLGRQHRAIIAVGWGAIGRSVLSLHGTVVADRSLHGPDAGAGYEYLSDGGLVFRVLAGGAYLSRSWQEPSARLRPALSVAFGWRLW
jgi:hypothetical protein